VVMRLPYQQGQLISLFHESGQVEQIEHGRGGVTIHGKLPLRLLARFQSYQSSNAEETPEAEAETWPGADLEEEEI
jgi:GTPase